MPGCIGPSSGMWPQRVLLLAWGTKRKRRRSSAPRTGFIECFSVLFCRRFAGVICRDMQVRRVTISFGCLRALVLIKSLLFVHPTNHQRNLLFIESVCPGIQISVEFLCLSGMIIGRARQMEIGRRLSLGSIHV